MSLKDRKANHKKTVSFMTDSIQAHKKTFQDNSARDFIDVDLAEIKRTADPSASFYDKGGSKAQKLSDYPPNVNECFNTYCIVY